jgi:spermidine/putrescine transport system substrate-binding protein
MFRTLAALVLALACALPAQAQKNRLNLFIWSEYIDPAIVAAFEKKFDCKVTIDLYEDNESMVAKLQGGGVSLYDVVVPSDYIIPIMLGQRLLAPLRAVNIPNLSNIDSRFAAREYDPGNRYSAPYQWGTVGIYARRAKGESVAESWSVLFDPAKAAGSFLMLDDARSMIGAALRYQGESVNCTDKAKLKAARDLLVEAKRRSLGFEGSVGGKNKVLARVCKLAVVYNGEAVPREGSEIWLDNLAIPAKAPNRDMAEKFVNYILDAKVGAQLSDFNQYATPNRAALDLVSEADRRNPVIYPSGEHMKVLEFVKDLGARGPWFDELWTAIKAR